MSLKRFHPRLAALSLIAVTTVVGAQTSNDENEGLEEIIVTAQKREQAFQDLAISAAVITKQELDKKGILQVQDAIKLVPGVKVQAVAGTGSGRIFIRGIGTTGRTDEYQEKFADGVALNLDGVSSNNASNTMNTMFDVERVEVLKGPQGTLYGSSALGGVVNVITASPKHELEAQVKMQFGDYSARLYQGMLNLPLGEQFAVRLTASNNERDGYVGGPSIYSFDVPPPLQADFLENWGSFDLPADSHGSVDSENYRIKALWEPNDRFSAIVSYEETSDKGTAPTWITADNALKGDLVCCTLDIPFPPFVNPQWFANAYYERGSETWTGLFNYDLGGVGELTFQLSSNTLKDVGRSQEMSPADLENQQALEQTQKTYELRLNSASDSKATWVVGAYVSTSDRELFANTGERVPSPDVDGDPATLEYGIYEIGKPFDTTNFFAQLTWPFTDVLRGTIGFRYAETDQQYSYELYRTENPCSEPPGAPPDAPPTCPSDDTVIESAQFSAGESDPNRTWKVGFEYDLAPESMLYGHVATGFKAGGVQLRDTTYSVTALAPLDLGSFDPERSLSYELGVKNRLFNNTLQLNAAAFYTKWDDLQINTFACATPGCQPFDDPTYAVFLNVADSKQYGLEVEGIWAATANDRVTFSMTTMHGRYGSGGYEAFGGYLDLTDAKMVQTPSFAAVAGYSHVFEFGSASLTGSIDAEYSSEYEVTHESNLVGHTQPSYFRTNASLTYEQGQFAVNAFLRNAQNETLIQTVFPFGVQASDPRLWGVSIQWTYQ